MSRGTAEHTGGQESQNPGASRVRGAYRFLDEVLLPAAREGRELTPVGVKHSLEDFKNDLSPVERVGLDMGLVSNLVVIELIGAGLEANEHSLKGKTRRVLRRVGVVKRSARPLSLLEEVDRVVGEAARIEAQRNAPHHPLPFRLGIRRI